MLAPHRPRTALPPGVLRSIGLAALLAALLSSPGFVAERFAPDGELAASTLWLIGGMRCSMAAIGLLLAALPRRVASWVSMGRREGWRALARATAPVLALEVRILRLFSKAALRLAGGGAGGRAGCLLWLGFALYLVPAYTETGTPAFYIPRLALPSPGAPWSAAFYGASVCVAFFAYAAALSAPFRRKVRPSFRWVAAWSLLFHLTASISAPFFDDDISELVLHSRMVAHHHMNPYLVMGADAAAIDEWAIDEMPSRVPGTLETPYGPLWTLLEGGIGWTTGRSSYLAGLLSFRILFTALNLGWAYALYRLRGRGSAGVRSALMYAWNPLVIVIAAASGHNDIMTAVVMGVGLVLWQRRHRLAGALSLVLSILTKFVPLALLPLLFAHEWNRGRGLRGVALECARFAALFIVLAGALYYPFDVGLGAIRSVALESGVGPALEGRFYYNSHSLLYAISEGAWRATRSIPLAHFIQAIFNVGFGVYLLSHLLGVGRARSLTQASGRVLFVFLLLFRGWLQFWYLVWFLVLIPVDATPTFRREALLFSFTGLLHTFAFMVTRSADYPQQLAQTFLFVGAPILLTLGHLARDRAPLRRPSTAP